MRATPTDANMLPALFALYDTLNDDTDEIRNVGAEAVSYILMKSLIPLAAQTEFLSWLSTKYKDSSDTPLLLEYVIRRITNTKENTSADHQCIRAQLIASLQEDNALFVEEEQNLFIDKVREDTQMLTLFASLVSTNTDFDTIAVFATWTIDGLQTLHELAISDKPLGWTSNPTTFAICSKILQCSNTLLKTEKESVGTASKSNHNHVGSRIRMQLEMLRAIEGFHPVLLEMVEGGLEMTRKPNWTIDSPGILH